MSKVNIGLTCMIVWLSILRVDASHPEDKASYSNEVAEIDVVWDFYWNQLYTPDNIEQARQSPEKIPSSTSWTEYGYPEEGHATYRLQVPFPDSIRDLSIFVPKIWSNSRVWINGELKSYRGQIPLVSSENNLILEALITEIKVADSLEILVQVANKDTYVAGLVYPFKLGSFASLNSQVKKIEAFQTLWIGALIMMGIFCVLLYLFQRHKVSYLLLSGICFLLILNMFVFGEHIFYQWLKGSGILNFKWQNTFYYLSIYSIASLGCAYVHSIYPEIHKKWPFYVLVAAISLYCLFISVTPLSVYAQTLLPFQLIIALAVLYVVFVMIMGIKNHGSKAANRVQIFGICCVILAGMSDGLYQYGFKTGWPQESLPYSLIIVIFLQMILLAYERQRESQKILDLVEHLEDRVKERTEEVEHQKLELRKVNEMKDKYLVKLSHDLRSPLSTIVGFCYIIKEEAERIPEDIRKFVQAAEVGVKKMETLIDHITTLSKIKQNGLSLEFQKVDVLKHVREQMVPYGPQLQKKSIKLSVESELDEIMAHVDPTHFFRVIQNLLVNAIQHTPEKGDIKIRVAQNENLVIQFLNSGVVLTSETRTKVSDRFYSGRKDIGGMGVGLELTHEIVALHSGQIKVKEVDGYNCFEITLPRKAEKE